MTAPLVGTFLALYLSEPLSTRNIRSQQAIATANILEEFANTEKSAR